MNDNSEPLNPENEKIMNEKLDEYIRSSEQRSKVYEEARRQNDADAELFWSRLTYTDKCNACHNVVAKIFEGEIKVKGSYRYVLYDIFKFGPDMYRRGVYCVFMDIHNSIMNDEQFAEANKWMLGAEQPAQQKPVAAAWDEGYRQGVKDERTSEANIGIAGYGAKVEPARQNPYGTTPPQRPWVWLTKEEVDSWELPDSSTVFEFMQLVEAKIKEKNT